MKKRTRKRTEKRKGTEMCAAYKNLSRQELKETYGKVKAHFDELKAKQEEKAVKQAVKFLEKRGYLVS